MSSTPASHRTITSKPRAGEKIKVETPTTIHSLLEFESGAIITMGTSWDVWHHDHGNMELYGEDGTLYVPDPNFFGGELQMSKGKKLKAKMPAFAHALGVPNQKHGQGMMANYRTAGLADMALAIQEDRPHRCSLEMSLHVVDVMVSILKAGDTGRAINLSTTCARPAALDKKEARSMMAPKPRAKK